MAALVPAGQIAGALLNALSQGFFSETLVRSGLPNTGGDFYF